jgi:hypothetical protein
LIHFEWNSIVIESSHDLINNGGIDFVLRMNNLFDNTEKLIVSEEYKIKNVLNPFNQIFIDEQQAKELGIIFNGYYRNCYGGLIPLVCLFYLLIPFFDNFSF